MNTPKLKTLDGFNLLGSSRAFCMSVIVTDRSKIHLRWTGVDYLTIFYGS